MNLAQYYFSSFCTPIISIKTRLEGLTFMLLTSFGSIWTWIVTWFDDRASWFPYNKATKQAKMAKLR